VDEAEEVVEARDVGGAGLDAAQEVSGLVEALLGVEASGLIEGGGDLRGQAHLIEEVADAASDLVEETHESSSVSGEGDFDRIASD
jgi:hypothetical protein